MTSSIVAQGKGWQQQQQLLKSLLLRQHANSTSCTTRRLPHLHNRVGHNDAVFTADCMTLVPWAVKNGIQFAKIKPFQVSQSGRGITATGDILPGDCVCNVPVSAALRVYPGCPPVLQLPHALWQQLPWYVQLSLLLLSELQKGPTSKWSDYIRQLPVAVDVPVLWDKEQLQALRCSYFIEQVQQQQDDWAALTRQVSQYLGASGVSREQLLWALSISRSRSFAAPYQAPMSLGMQWLKGQAQGQQQQHVLCPFLDLFNHNGNVQSECEFYYGFRSQAFRVVSSQAWPRGQQVFINYGAASNDALLQLYGFVEQDNPEDRYVVRSLPAALEQQGIPVPAEAVGVVAEVVLTRDGMEAAPAAVLAGLLGGGSNPSAESQRAGLVSWSSMSHGVRSIISAAVQEEVSDLTVDIAECREVLVAFQQLPDKQAELSRKQAELSDKQAELSRKQAELECMQEQGTTSSSSMLQQTPQAAAHHAQGMLPTGENFQQHGSNEHQGAVSAEPHTQLTSAACDSQVGECCAEAQAHLAADYHCCLDVCNRLKAEVGALQALVLKWSQMVAATHKVTAAMYVLEKRKLLVDVLSRLQDLQ